MLEKLRSIFGGKGRASADPRELGEPREPSSEGRRAKTGSSVSRPPHSETWETARATLLPVLRGATYGVEMWAKQRSAAFARRPFLPYIDHAVVIDEPTSMHYVSRHAIERWGVTEEAVFAAAEERLSLLAAPSVEPHDDDAHGPLWIVTSNDTYESSRLLVRGWLASFRGRVEGNPVAIIPERSTLIVGGDARPEMIELLLDKAEEEFTASKRRLSPALYSVDAQGAVVPYARRSTDPLAAKVKVAHEKLAIYEHRAQKEVLDALHEEREEDVFVGRYLVFEGADAPLPRSLSVWTKGVRSYLPRTEKVILLVPGEGPGAKPKASVEVPFEAIRDRLTPVPEHRPERFETTGEFPTDGELRSFTERPSGGARVPRPQPRGA